MIIALFPLLCMPLDAEYWITHPFTTNFARNRYRGAPTAHNMAIQPTAMRARTSSMGRTYRQYLSTVLPLYGDTVESSYRVILSCRTSYFLLTKESTKLRPRCTPISLRKCLSTRYRATQPLGSNPSAYTSNGTRETILLIGQSSSKSCNGQSHCLPILLNRSLM
ncbi:hypothetical protein GB937_003715 [Aspergillus fischeri]|nr:hypothetical protein GB937_003715 [Aspergillus fischeri]